MKIIDQFLCGFLFIFKGTKILFQKSELLKWAIIPFIINFIIIILAFKWGIGQSDEIVSQTIGFFGGSEGLFYKILYYPIKLTFILTYSVTIIYLSFLLATAIASPFNAILAEKTLFHLGFIQEKSFNLVFWLKASFKMFLAALLRAVIFLIAGTIIFILSFIPVINFFSTFAAFLIIALDCMDYSMEACLMSLRQRWEYFLKTPFYFCGMALALSLTVLIPGLTLLLLPSSVVGAAWIMTKTKDCNEAPTAQSHL